ncbi:MAG TPA: hypothetical protein VGM87_08520 [Roseomonas sp.]|jgi:hypothetical protein
MSSALKQPADRSTPKRKPAAAKTSLARRRTPTDAELRAEIRRLQRAIDANLDEIERNLKA